MDALVQTIADSWPIVLAGIAATLITLIGIVVHVCRAAYRLYTGWPKATKLEPVEGGAFPVNAHALRSAMRYHLIGNRGIVTGLIRLRNVADSSFSVSLFPYSSSIDVKCQLAIDAANIASALDDCDFVSVVGDITDIQADYGRYTIQLKNCRTQRPPFVSFLRYAWYNSVLAESLRRIFWWLG